MLLTGTLQPPDGSRRSPLLEMRIIAVPGDKVINLDEALLETCSGEERQDLLGEAILLAETFAPEGGRPELLAMAQTLTAAPQGDPAERRHTRKLAATLRDLAGQAKA